ncbi:MAG: CpsD/CapB family tyrosine-protein kinase, partial [Synergistales bacterium]|nr:CpsD/CapB family tyrosine-protein kinase [Synergistales bacterium]
NGLQTARDVEQKLGLVTLVSMPKVPTEKGHDGKPVNALDYLIAKPLSAFSEALRSLRSALQLSNVDNPPKVILFTSALPSEGKTTTAASFARAAAASGLKVILLDCDLRHPSVHRTFNIARPDEGLVELLAERLDPATVIVKDTKSELDLLPVAMGTANPPDVLASSQMKLLLQRFRDEYDLVVLDSAPVLPVADSRVLARMVDEVVFVIRWNATPRDAALAAIKELRQYDATIAGAVLTVVDTAKQAKYGYGDGGYYYASYSKYYAN